jgi:hypothetical protein
MTAAASITACVTSVTITTTAAVLVAAVVIRPAAAITAAVVTAAVATATVTTAATITAAAASVTVTILAATVIIAAVGECWNRRRSSRSQQKRRVEVGHAHAARRLAKRARRHVLLHLLRHTRASKERCGR